MAYHLQWTPDNEGAHLTFRGEVSGRRIYIANAELYADARFEHCGYALWDFTYASLSGMDSEHGELFAAADKLVSKEYPRKCMLMVATARHTLDVFEAYQAEMERLNCDWHVGIFSTADEALRFYGDMSPE